MRKVANATFCFFLYSCRGRLPGGVFGYCSKRVNPMPPPTPGPSLKGMEMELTKANYKDYIDANKVVLVDFYGKSCGPCIMLEPTLERLAEAYAGSGQVGIAKVDVAQNPELVVELDIRKTPTLVLYQDGQERERLMGGQRLKVLKEKIDQLLV